MSRPSHRGPPSPVIPDRPTCPILRASSDRESGEGSAPPPTSVKSSRHGTTGDALRRRAVIRWESPDERGDGADGWAIAWTNPTANPSTSAIYHDNDGTWTAYPNS